jgi:hypothetical protein
VRNWGAIREERLGMFLITTTSRGGTGRGGVDGRGEEEGRETV